MSQFMRLLLIVFAGVAAVSSGRIQKRVVNGDNTPYGQVPYMVSLRLTSTSSHFCGGSIITPEHVITAAHCVVVGLTEIPVQPSERFIVSGHVDNWRGGRVTQIAAIYNHPEYNVSQTYRNDISILVLATPIPFTVSERPIPIASSDTGIQTCLVSGWGFTHTPVSHSPGQLQMQLQRTISHEVCSSWLNPFVHTSTLCAGASRGTGICSGDSGGPLVCNGELAGVVSWGFPCANGFPDGYARVFYYRDWILLHITSLSPSMERNLQDGSLMNLN